MRHIRIYQYVDLKIGNNITLDTKASHHLAHVLRIKTKRTIILFNGLGGEFLCEISAIEKNKVIVKILEFIDIQRAPSLCICLGQCISKKEHMDFAIQKATELGVSEITPVISQHGDVKLTEHFFKNRIEHWKNIIISACEQCGRNLLPRLNTSVTFSDWIQQKFNTTYRFILDASGSSLSDVAIFQKKMVQSEVVITIGPEGGFSQEEISLAKEHQFIPIRLGLRTLRTETATLASITLCQTLWGDFK